MLAGLLSSATTFFATIGPIEAAVLFATLTPKMDRPARQAIALKATLIATGILLVFTLFGQPCYASSASRLQPSRRRAGSSFC